MPEHIPVSLDPDKTHFVQLTIPFDYRVEIGVLWTDTTAALLKRCTSVTPITFVSTEAGGGGGLGDPGANGFVVRTALDTTVARTFITPNAFFTITNPTGVAGNPSLDVSVPFSRSGSIIQPLGALTVVAWRALFACTVTAVKGYRVGGTGATVNARKNGSLSHLASDLSLSSADTWLDGGAVQNTSYVVGDLLELRLISIAGSPTQVAIQVDFTRT